MLLWGVIPHCIPFSETPETTANVAVSLLLKEKYVKKGQRVVVVSDMGKGTARVMSIQIRMI
jgi:pyruvate kinase